MVFAENFGWVGFLVVCLLYKTIPTHERFFPIGKSGPNATFNLNFLGLGWPWVGEFVGFTIPGDTYSEYMFSNPV